VQVPQQQIDKITERQLFSFEVETAEVRAVGKAAPDFRAAEESLDRAPAVEFSQERSKGLR
jgi:hypothetical protein